MCGALAMKVNHEALVQALHSVKPTKAGERSSSRWLPAIATGSRRTRCRLVSPSRPTTIAKTTAPSPPSSTKIARQPNHCVR